MAKGRQKTQKKEKKEKVWLSWGKKGNIMSIMQRRKNPGNIQGEMKKKEEDSGKERKTWVFCGEQRNLV